MPLEKDTGIHGVDLDNIGGVDVLDETVEKETEVFTASKSCIVIVVDCDSVNIIDFRFHSAH